MADRVPPIPELERARLTEELKRSGGTDIVRWAQPNNLAVQWDARAAMAAKLIPDGGHILDIGAGAMALRRFLPPGCQYQPADVVERCPGCFVIDLNKDEFPQGTYDCVTFLGVLEYVHNPLRVLEKTTRAAAFMVVTYCCAIHPNIAMRRGMGWVNDFTNVQFELLLDRAGWIRESRREIKRGPGNIQFIYQCSRAE